MGDGRNCGNVGDVELRVTHGFYVDCANFGVDRGGDGGWILALDELYLDVEFGEIDPELVVSTAVEVRRTDEILPGLADGRDSEELELCQRPLVGDGTNYTCAE